MISTEIVLILLGLILGTKLAISMYRLREHFFLDIEKINNRRIKQKELIQEINTRIDSLNKSNKKFNSLQIIGDVLAFGLFVLMFILSATYF